MDVTQDTRPDPKAQIEALFEVGRVMVEKGLPPLAIRVHRTGDVDLTFYDHRDDQLSADETHAVVVAWSEALGLANPHVHEHEEAPGRHLRYESASGVWAGFRVMLNTAGRVAPAEVQS